jgi:Protein of unknown function (DUF4239)
MSTLTQNLLFVALTVIVSLLFMALLNRLWPREKRVTHNDLIGWQLSILGTTYAVILGFMLYAVWTSFGEATLNADFEADSIVDIYRLAQALPEPQRSQLQTQARNYVDAVINYDWPEMYRNRVPERSVAVNAEMWKTALAVEPTSNSQTTAQDHVLTELGALTQHRLTRLLESTAQLPTVLWGVLLVGGILTIVASCTFGAESLRLQAVQVFSFALLVSLTLVAIADIHRPFQGVVHVPDLAFRRALHNMQP